MMVTSCPGCTTAFRVTAEQLKAMHGKVRCSQCQMIFNAIDTLLDIASEPIASTEALPDLFEPETSLSASASTAAPAAEIGEEPPASRSLTSEPLAEPGWQAERIESLLHRDATPARRTWAWALAAVLFLLLLLLQTMLHFRVELSVLAPDTKPLLRNLCRPLGCDIPLPSKGDLISIESSDLHPDTKGQLVLVAMLKNRAPFAQAYPHLELTLTDIADQPLWRKVLAPIDYLPGNTNIATGFATHGEISVNLALKHEHADSSAATGYRLYLFYP